MQGYLVKLSFLYLRKSLAFTDERSKLESELLSGIDVVKCSAWEVGELFSACDTRGGGGSTASTSSNAAPAR